jgi:hypothetical protein
LSGPGRMIGQAFSLRPGVARDLAEALLNLSSHVAGGAFHAILIHGRTLFGNQPGAVEPGFVISYRCDSRRFLARTRLL